MNSNKLKGKIVERGLTQEELALKLNISKQTLNAKINNRAPMTIEEANQIIQILQINNPSIIFFE